MLNSASGAGGASNQASPPSTQRAPTVSEGELPGIELDDSDSVDDLVHVRCALVCESNDFASQGAELLANERCGGHEEHHGTQTYECRPLDL